MLITVSEKAMENPIHETPHVRAYMKLTNPKKTQTASQPRRRVKYLWLITMIKELAERRWAASSASLFTVYRI